MYRARPKSRIRLGVVIFPREKPGGLKRNEPTKHANQAGWFRGCGADWPVNSHLPTSQVALDTDESSPPQLTGALYRQQHACTAHEGAGCGPSEGQLHWSLRRARYPRAHAGTPLTSLQPDQSTEFARLAGRPSGANRSARGDGCIREDAENPGKCRSAPTPPLRPSLVGTAPTSCPFPPPLRTSFVAAPADTSTACRPPVAGCRGQRRPPVFSVSAGLTTAFRSSPSPSSLPHSALLRFGCFSAFLPSHCAAFSPPENGVRGPKRPRRSFRKRPPRGGRRSSPSPYFCHALWIFSSLSSEAPGSWWPPVGP